MTTIVDEELVAYDRGRVCEEMSRIARLLDTVIIPHVQSHPDDEWAQLVLGQLVGVKTALQLLARDA
ncbi:hypothetical protein [Actinoplanes regularis]|uniref:Uncharacterized protein n=1 Tax=Actinoplanes regularis TaxID=52697 RepID=A0A239KF38_9ACTN|nr:hypothetical protein [Actinoplanes regularis]GIE90702.1 hypothetical protein Are01nite_71820 [Actinoplanes regularis]SNT16322.1 hypothetical protein SAMN06264365_1485 [Actinoplanes regularis]